ncbi:hypothetical protein BJY52DRAFT_1293443, partial [Lactarius psammicola]
MNTPVRCVLALSSCWNFMTVAASAGADVMTSHAAVRATSPPKNTLTSSAAFAPSMSRARCSSSARCARAREGPSASSRADTSLIVRCSAFRLPSSIRAASRCASAARWFACAVRIVRSAFSTDPVNPPMSNTSPMPKVKSSGLCPHGAPGGHSRTCTPLPPPRSLP